MAESSAIIFILFLPCPEGIWYSPARFIRRTKTRATEDGKEYFSAWSGPVFHLAGMPTPYPGGSGRCSCRLPSRTANGLPLFNGGSAPATAVSGPAQRSRMFRPACSLSPLQVRGNIYDGAGPDRPEVAVAFRVGGIRPLYTCLRHFALTTALPSCIQWAALAFFQPTLRSGLRVSTPSKSL